MNKSDTRRLRRRAARWAALGAGCAFIIAAIAPFLRHPWVDLVALLLCCQLDMVSVVRIYYISRRLFEDDDTVGTAGP